MKGNREKVEGNNFIAMSYSMSTSQGTFVYVRDNGCDCYISLHCMTEQKLITQIDLLLFLTMGRRLSYDYKV
jgi:hypothetical protein